MLIGYARVSTLEQDTELQLRALQAAGVRKVYQEKASGAGLGQRLQLLQLLDQLRAGDTVVVYKLDRLARSLRDLMTIAERIESAGATFRSLTESFDTSTPAGRMAFSMLGAVAEFERNLIRERAIAGARVARSSGVRFGRPPKLTEQQKRKALQLLATQRYGLAELAGMHKVSVSTLKRVIAEAGADHLAIAQAPASAPGKKRAARSGLKGSTGDRESRPAAQSRSAPNPAGRARAQQGKTSSSNVRPSRARPARK